MRGEIKSQTFLELVKARKLGRKPAPGQMGLFERKVSPVERKKREIEEKHVRQGRRPSGRGWQAIPKGKRGGYRRRKGKGWEYWYPDKKPHGLAEKPKAKPRPKPDAARTLGAHARGMSDEELGSWVEQLRFEVGQGFTEASEPARKHLSPTLPMATILTILEAEAESRGLGLPEPEPLVPPEAPSDVLVFDSDHARKRFEDVQAKARGKLEQVARRLDTDKAWQELSDNGVVWASATGAQLPLEGLWQRADWLVGDLLGEKVRRKLVRGDTWPWVPRSRWPADRHPDDYHPDTVGPLTIGMDIAEAEDAIRNKSVEHGVIIAKDGRHLGRFIGSRTKLNFPPGVAATCFWDGGATLTHNHPQGAGELRTSIISVPDILVAVVFNLAEMRACGPGGAWVLRRPKGGWGVEPHLQMNLKGALRNASKRARKALRESYRELETATGSERIDALQRHREKHWQEHLKAFNETLAGWTGDGESWPAQIEWEPSTAAGAAGRGVEPGGGDAGRGLAGLSRPEVGKGFGVLLRRVRWGA